MVKARLVKSSAGVPPAVRRASCPPSVRGKLLSTGQK
jgi:hypothetical protein